MPTIVSQWGAAPVGIVEGDALADRVASGEVAADERVADDRDVRRQPRVGVPRCRGPGGSAAAASRSSRAARRGRRRPVGRRPAARGRPATSKPRVQTSPTSGAWLTALAASTPGSRRTASTASVKNAARRPGSAADEPCTDTDIVSTPRGSKPGSSADAAARLRSVSPAPISRTSASASSETTKTSRSSASRPWPVVPRAPRRSPMRVRAACHAGTRPKTRPVTIETPSVKASVQPSTAMSAARGRSGGAIAATARTPNAARARPTTLLRPASSRLSASSWRTIWNRVAPSARRTAISDCRVAARASSMCATLAQAISRTKPTATSSTDRPSRVWPTTRSFSGTTCTPRLVPGNACFEPRGHEVDVGLGRGRRRRRASAGRRCAGCCRSGCRAGRRAGAAPTAPTPSPRTART